MAIKEEFRDSKEEGVCLEIKAVYLGFIREMI